MHPQSHLAVDFESYYDTRITLKKMGVQEYLSQTEVYLVSAYDGNGTNLACAPNEFNWSLLHNRLVVSHNANFDAQVFAHLQSSGIIPHNIQPREWNCTANLAAYVGSPRSLDKASSFLLKEEISKDVRKRLRGKKWLELPRAFQAEVILYAIRDSKNCWELWNKYSNLWPEKERAFSLLTLSMCAHGVQLDAERLDEARSLLWQQKEDALNLIPWRESAAPLSYAAYVKECQAEGIEPAASLAITDEECDAWMEMYRGKYPWVEAMRNYRRCNILDKKIDKMLARQRGDGRMPYELKYWGGHTGRDSGSGGINLQNLPHGDLYGVDLRSAIVPPDRNILISADLSQIEARILLTLVKDTGQLELIRSGQSPYEAHARTTMGYSEPVMDKKSGTYRLAKARVLALGYSAGWRKFNVMAYLPVYLGREAAKVFAAPVTKSDVAAFSEYLYAYEKDKPTREKWRNRTSELETEWTNSWLIVRDYRATNYRIPRFWKHLDDDARGSVGGEYSVGLPSGRTLRYASVKCSAQGELTALTIRGDKQIRVRLYGGKICENIVQAIARDIFMEACLRVTSAGYRIILRIHDEILVEVERSKAENARAELEALMGVSPTWLANCPVSAEAKILERYTK